ncbi:MAG: HNH endonuclease signature motif containing protein, partial [Dehalococcoidales bacterium]|nr:HNH endonuclease signature motif containing protein [Dehalococcoidales bacterium]
MIYIYVGIAIVVLGSAAYLIYRKRSGQSPQGSEAEPSEQAPKSEASEMEPEEEAHKTTSARPAAQALRGTSRTVPERPATPSTGGAYRRTPAGPAAPPARGPSRTVPVRPVAPPTRGGSRTTPARPATPAARGDSKITPEPSDAPDTKKATYPIKEYSTLSDDAKVQFLNAVWYRCENPYCNHTEFLDVHHIIDDGSNNLNNLI